MTAPVVTFDELYDNEQHVCAELIYVPDECPPCARCNHGDCRHPDGADCQAIGCDCTRILADGDCRKCDGEGWVEADADRIYTCRACIGGRAA